MCSKKFDKSDGKGKRQQSILGALDDLISIVDKNYRYIAISKGYTDFFGKQYDDIIGKHVEEIHGEERFYNNIKPFLDKTLLGEEVRLQFWGENKTGELRFLDSKHTPYIGRLSKELAVAVVARDITELVQAQTALEGERNLLNTMVNAIPDFIFSKDSDGIYQLCNGSFEEFVGISKENIIGKTDYEIMSKASAQYIVEKDSEIKTSLQSVRVDEWVTYNDGRKRLLDMYKLPLLDNDRKATGIIGIGRNVTHEREAEEKLLLASLVFDTTLDACLILSKEGRILSSNLAAKEQFKELKHNEDQSLSALDLFYTPNSDSSGLVRILTTEKSWHGEICSSDHRHYVATLNAALDNVGRVEKIVFILRDNQHNFKLEKDLVSKAYSDALTGLPNRLLFMSRLESAIIRAERQRRQIAVFFIDLDKFKPINDKYGHLEGDKVLADIAQRLREKIRETDTLARLGGDEFVALIDIESEKQAKAVAKKLVESLEQVFTIGSENKPILISASIGISLFPSDAVTAQALLHLADQAMYKAKRSLSDAYRFHESQ